MKTRKTQRPALSRARFDNGRIQKDGLHENSRRGFGMQPSSPTSSGKGSVAPLSPELLRNMDAYWRAANYLSVGQIYLYDNPLLRQPLSRKHIKPRLLGHWGTTPGLNFIYVHLNRII